MHSADSVDTLLDFPPPSQASHTADHFLRSVHDATIFQKPTSKIMIYKEILLASPNPYRSLY
jgi:hypothetical protein